MKMDLEEDFTPMQSAENDTLVNDCSKPDSTDSESIKEEPQIIKDWKETQIKRLEIKDKEEECAKIALRQKAKNELEDWYRQHSEQLLKLQAAHRAASESAEKEYSSTTHQIHPGTEWERVAKLCDFNPKMARNTKDVGRMRSVILQLKQSNSGQIST